MIKANNKFNIGDLVYVSGLSDETKKRYKVECMYVRVYDDYVPKTTYGMLSEEGKYTEELGGMVIPEEDLFWTYEELINRKQYGVVKQAKSHFKGILGRLFVLLYMLVLAIPFLVFQFFYWLFTGRKESRSYNYMDRIIGKLG